MSWYKKLGSALKEVRFVLSTSQNNRSEGARLFLKEHYSNIIGQSPNFKFYVRECEGIDSFAIFRYDYGVEQKQLIEDLDKHNIEKLFEEKIQGAEKINKSL